METQKIVVTPSRCKLCGFETCDLKVAFAHAQQEHPEEWRTLCSIQDAMAMGIPFSRPSQ